MVSTEKVLLTSACGLCKDRYESISNQEVVAETHKGREEADLEDRESATGSSAQVRGGHWSTASWRVTGDRHQRR